MNVFGEVGFYQLSVDRNIDMYNGLCTFHVTIINNVELKKNLTADLRDTTHD